MSTLSPDCQAWLDEQESAFMRPECDLLTDAEATGEDGADDTALHYWSRLSAPGYLDCTDWIGPYDTAEQALEALYDMFGE